VGVGTAGASIVHTMKTTTKPANVTTSPSALKIKSGVKAGLPFIVTNHNQTQVRAR
jgi:hypothetical protein